MIEAAVGLIATQGFAKTTLTEIGAHAGVSGTLISNRFGSKEGLLHAVLSHIVGQFLIDLNDAQPKLISISRSGPELNLSDVRNTFACPLNQFIEVYFECVSREQSGMRALHVILDEPLGTLMDVRLEISRINALLRSIIEYLISAGVSAGEYRADINSSDAAIITFGILRGVANQIIHDPDGVRIENLIPLVQKAVHTSLLR